MRRVGRIASPTDVAFGRPFCPESGQANGPAPIMPSRALVPVGAPDREDERPRGRPASYFVAHLIATKDQLPQTRERRRAEPVVGIAAYSVKLGTGPFSGRVLARVA